MLSLHQAKRIARRSSCRCSILRESSSQTRHYTGNRDGSRGPIESRFLSKSMVAGRISVVRLVGRGCYKKQPATKKTKAESASEAKAEKERGKIKRKKRNKLRFNKCYNSMSQHTRISAAILLCISSFQPLNPIFCKLLAYFDFT